MENRKIPPSSPAAAQHTQRKKCYTKVTKFLYSSQSFCHRRIPHLIGTSRRRNRCQNKALNEYYVKFCVYKVLVDGVILICYGKSIKTSALVLYSTKEAVGAKPPTGPADRGALGCSWSSSDVRVRSTFPRRKIIVVRVLDSRF